MLIKKTEEKQQFNITQSFDNYRNFMSDFFEIFKIVKPDLTLFDNENINWKKLVLVLLWSNNDLKIYDYMVLKYKLEKNKLDLYCLWKNWFETFLWSGFNMLWYSNITNDVQELDLENLWSCVSGIKSWKYEDISICYLDDKSEIVEFDLFPICWLDINYFSDRFNIKYDYDINDIQELCIWPWNREVEEDILIQYIQHIVYWIILERKFYKINDWSLVSLKVIDKIAAN